jgi:heme oxygenase
MTTPLSILLREGTRDSHRLAENSPFIRDFFQRKLSLISYREFLVQLRYIYSALEESQERHRTHPVLGRVHFPSLYRTLALEKDLDFYFENEDWRALPPHPATSVYIQRITTLSEAWVEGLIAHHYTRYLGDLSGGQVLKQIVAKTFNRASGAGLAFYEFSQIPDHKVFKEKYRARLDAMPLDETTSQKIVDEANYAFELNRSIFDSMLEPVK